MENTLIEKQINKVLLVSDLDGTLLNKNYEISKENEKAIKGFIERGGLFTIATGRMGEAVFSFLHQLDINIPVVLYNGAQIYCPTKKSLLYEKKLEVKREVLQEILSIHREDVAVQLYQDGEIYTPYKNHLVLKHQEHEGVECKDLSQRETKESLTKIIIITTTHDQAKTIEKVIAQMDLVCDMVYSEKNYLEILPSQASKGAALAKLKKMLEIEDHYTITVGDQPNDVSLMQVADLGIAVGNANSQLKKAADIVTVSHDQHAIAAVINQMDTLVKAEETG